MLSKSSPSDSGSRCSSANGRVRSSTGWTDSSGIPCFWARWADVLLIVKPETVVGRHRAGFRLYWRWRSRARSGRPKITAEIRQLIRRLAQEKAGWGAPKIHAEVLKLGLQVSERTVARYLRRVGRRGDAGKQWQAFLQNHREVIVAFDLYRTDADVPTALLFFCNRTRPSENPALQRDAASECGLGHPTIARSVS